jgi:hypothetical protein
MAGLKETALQLTVFLLVNSLALTPAWAKDEFWIKKPYQNWSAEETKRVLEDSPWASTLPLIAVQAAVTGGGSALGGEMEATPSVTYTVQFRSARPIREAQVRSYQIGAHYDAMSADKKSAFDANAAKFLAATFPDRIVVAVTFKSNVENYDSFLRDYWAKQSLAKLSGSTFLNTRKEKLNMVSYSVKEDTFQMTFPRPKDLQADEKISVEFGVCSSQS